MKVSPFIIFLFLLGFSSAIGQRFCYTREQFATKLIRRVDSFSYKLFNNVVNGKVQAFINDSTKFQISEAAQSEITYSIKDLKASYNKETQVNTGNSTYRFSGLWLTADVKFGEVDMMPLYAVVFVGRDEMKKVFSDDDFEKIMFLSDLMFAGNGEVNNSKGSVAQASKQEIVRRNIEYNITNKVNYALLDSSNLTLLSNYMLDAMAGNCRLFMKSSDPKISGFCSDWGLTSRISTEGLQKLLKESYSNSESTSSGVFDFTKAVSVCFTSVSIGFGYDSNFNLYIRKPDFVKTLPKEIANYLSLINPL